MIEQYIRSKAGIDLKTCEDDFAVTADFCCVVDGATSVTGGRWTSASITGGQWASRILIRGVKNLPPTCTPREAVDLLTECIHSAYRSEEGVLDIMDNDPEERATASMVLYSRHLDQLVCVGDCQAALIDKDGKIFQVIQPEKFNDVVMSQARCMFLQLEIANGATKESLLQANADPGRVYIEPLRKGQRKFQNNPKAPHPYQYWVMDGYPVSDKGIAIVKIPRKTRQIVLASDGYPKLFPTLEKTEMELKSILDKDPLLMNEVMGTKGVRPGAESFDDRTYLRVDLGKSSFRPSTATFVAISSMVLFLVRRMIPALFRWSQHEV